jgi:hypothetical protein
MADENIIVPSLTSVNIIFIAITAIYLCVKFTMESKNNWMIIISYLIIVLFTQYLYNVWIILGTFKTSNTSLALTSMVFWGIFILIYFIINFAFPAWKMPFSNTIGYAIANIINPIRGDLLRILRDSDISLHSASPPATVSDTKTTQTKGETTKMTGETTQTKGEITHQTGGAHQNDDNTLALAIKQLKSKPDIVLLLPTDDEGEKFFDILKKEGFFNPNESDLAKVKNQILMWYRYKNIIAEGVWLILAGSLTIAVTYYYIISAPISSSPAAIEKSDANLKQKDKPEVARPTFVTI